VPVKRDGEWGNGGHRWILEECIWHGHADNSAYIVRGAHGGISAGCQHNSCRTGENRWCEVREHFEPGAYSRKSQGGGNSGNSGNFGNRVEDENVEPWSAPAAFHSYDLPEFPQGVFPEWMSAYTEALSVSTQTPRDLAGMLGLTVGAVGSAKLVEVEVWDGWREPTNLFTATVLRPGTRKTEVFKRMASPVMEYERELVGDTERDIAQAHSKYRIYEGRLKKAEQQAAKAEPRELDDLEAKAIEAAEDLAQYRSSGGAATSGGRC
jgi:hypothetical protein